MPHPAGRFDGVTIAFGIRNVVDRLAGLREMHRVLKPSGRAVILEFSQPRSNLFQGVYHFYFRRILPGSAVCCRNAAPTSICPIRFSNFPTSRHSKPLWPKPVSPASSTGS